jgi:hypothetical protein
MRKIINYKITYFILLSWLLMFYNCSNKEIIISYTDGNGNIFNINNSNNKTLEFKPIKPQFSSSGIYNGGNYSKNKITDNQYNEIISVINKAIKNKSIHIKKRIKKSGLITVEKNKIRKTYIINPKAIELHDIEYTFNKIIHK